MLKKILKKDLLRNRLIIAILFLFITLASMLASSAISLTLNLSGSVRTFFEKAGAPHYVQMYFGDLDQNAIDDFTNETDMVKKQQTATLLNINGAYISIGNKKETEANSVLENSFVVQNKHFDYLLNQKNEVMQVKPGEIGVPVYYMKQKNLKPGDKLTISKGHFSIDFIVKDFVRDVQMNSSMVTSKRFLIHEDDMHTLEKNIGEKEYLIEFLLKDSADLTEFETLYQSSNLPQSGTAITYPLYQLLNSISDGIIIAVVILIALLLMIISFVSLRFILLSAIEEDYQEIGNMKAIGISYKQIRLLYVTKYLFISTIACILGYLLSLILGGVLSQNIQLYMGTGKTDILQRILPILGAVFIFLMIFNFCNLILRRFKKIAVVDAMRNNSSSKHKNRTRLLQLHKNKRVNVNLFLGWKELLVKFRTYGLLCLVFVICMFLMIVPLNFLNTLKSPTFISYMGAGQSDIRIDLSQSDDMEKEYSSIIEKLEQDTDVERYTPFVTSSYKTKNADGELENLKVENGDFTVFPLTYISGHAPKNDKQIALSAMNAEELKKQVGSNITIVSDNKKYHLEVSGIYQDITNGGKTAKAMLPYERENILWYIVNLNIKNTADLKEKITEYTDLFPSARATDMKSYINQTFGSVIDSLNSIIKLAILLSLAVAMLITSLFLKLLIVNERISIASMYSIGFSIKDIRRQYMTRILSVLIVGIIIGTILSGTIGSYFAGAMLTGISHLEFIVNPFTAYVMCPLLLITTVFIVTTISTRPVKETGIMTLQNER